MSTLGTKEQETINICESYAYVTKAVGIENYHFKWTIQNFNNLRNFFKDFEKPFFPPESRSKYEWFWKVQQIVVNHGSFYQSNNKQIFFTLCSTEPVQKFVNIRFSLKSLDGVYNKSSFAWDFIQNSKLFSLALNVETFNKYMKWNDTHENRDLSIICEVSLTESIEDFQIRKKMKFNDDEEDVSDHKYSVLNDKSFKDFSFVVKNETFHVSKVILALESPVFTAMFKSKMMEDLNSKAIITDTEPEIFKKMIQFIYNQEVDEADLKKSASELLKVAHKYDVKKLKQICANFLYEKKLCVDNAVEILLLADLYSIPELKKKALRIIKFNSKFLKESEDYKSFIKKGGDLVLELFNVEEDSDDHYFV